MNQKSYDNPAVDAILPMFLSEIREWEVWIDPSDRTRMTIVDLKGQAFLPCDLPEVALHEIARRMIKAGATVKYDVWKPTIPGLRGVIWHVVARVCHVLGIGKSVTRW